ASAGRNAAAVASYRSANSLLDTKGMQMRRTIQLIVVSVAIGGFSYQVNAQPPPPGGPGGGRPMNPLIRALDTDGDGEISAAEIEKAATALKALDRNNDGKLTDD